MADGPHSVVLTFVEPSLHPGERIFDVFANGQKVLTNPIQVAFRDRLMPSFLKLFANPAALDWVYSYRVDWDEPSHHAIRAAFNAAPTSALVLTGGETAAFVLCALQASSILLTGEIAPGIPWGIIQGGDADGRMVITKSGGFGDRNTLADAFDFCQRIDLRRACASA